MGTFLASRKAHINAILAFFLMALALVLFTVADNTHSADDGGISGIGLDIPTLNSTPNYITNYTSFEETIENDSSVFMPAIVIDEPLLKDEVGNVPQNEIDQEDNNSENNYISNETIPEEVIIRLVHSLASDTFQLIPVELDDGEYTLLRTEDGEELSYDLEMAVDVEDAANQLGNSRIRLYPSLRPDQLDFTEFDMAGYVVLTELSRRTIEPQFIEGFVLDTRNARFTDGSFTMTAGGSKLYMCLSWDDEHTHCTKEWIKVLDLSPGQEYSIRIIENEYVAFAETPVQYRDLAEMYTSENNWLTENGRMVENNPFAIQTVINGTFAGGLVVYEERNSGLPIHRVWNVSGDFDTNKTTTTTVGADITWITTRANHERDEVIIGVEDKDLDINIQVYNSSGQWSNLQEVSTDVLNSNSRSFDIAVEDVSGDVLILYENSSALTNSRLAYRIWNGTAYSSEEALDTSLTANVIRWVQLASRPGTDQIMALIHNNVGDLEARFWNGTGFDSVRNLTISEATSSSVSGHFSFAWEGLSGDGLVGYGEGTNFVYRNFSLTSPYWSGESTIALGNSLDTTRFCSDSRSDYIGVLVQDGGADVNIRMWNGTEIAGSSPTEEASSNAGGANSGNIECVWYNSTNALFGFSDSAATSMDYVTFSQPNTWSTAALDSADTTANISTGTIEDLRFTQNPITNEVMVIAMNTAEVDLAHRWNGTAFVNVTASPFSALTEVLGGAQESVMFDWFRFDPVPNVTAVNPSGNSYSPSTSIEINATVRDNVNVSKVFANITLPNGTISQLQLTDLNNDNLYNQTFSTTSTVGSYTFIIVANDTSTHQNYNTTSTGSFTIAESVFPNVTNVLPVNNSVSNVSNIIEIGANVSDNTGVSRVLANVTYPNGTINQLTLSNGTDHNDKFNVSFTAPALIGVYNITFIANDTSNNINNSQTTNFTVNDIANPLVVVGFCLPNQINMSTTAVCNATITDDVTIFQVTANLTYPNGSIRQQMVNNASSHFNFTFTNTVVIGRYNITWFANDTSGNVNSSGTANFTVYDVVNPAVVVGFCFPNQINISTTAVCNATITDDVTIFQVVANLTYPNGTIRQPTINNASSHFNFTFTNTVVIGRYNITWFANDTSGNVNSSGTANFTVYDITAPNVTTITPLDGSSVEQDISVHIQANVSDNVSVNTVLANITLPNGTLRGNTLTDANSDSIYNITFTETSATGVYQILFVANDSSNNINSSVQRNFTVTTAGSPLVTLASPADTAATNDNTPNFVCNATDTSGLANISLYHNVSGVFTFNQSTNISGTSNQTNFTAVTIADGIYSWNCLASDSLGNRAFASSNFTVTIDTAVPSGGGISSGSGSTRTRAPTATTTITPISGIDAGAVSQAPDLETISFSHEVIHIKRGQSQDIPVRVTNIYHGAMMKDVILTVDGFLSQHISISPPTINLISPLNTKEFVITLAVPSYFAAEEYLLTAKVTAVLAAQNPDIAEFTTKEITEFKAFTLKVDTLEEGDVSQLFVKGETLIAEMKEAGFFTETVERFLFESQQAIDDGDFDRAKLLLDQIAGDYRNSFAADTIIGEIRKGIVDASDKWLETPQTEDALALSLLAFNRGDYALAAERAKNAQLILVLETKGRINLIRFILKWWWLIISGLIVLSIVGAFAYKRSLASILDYRLKNLNKEEDAISSVLIDLQKQYLVEGSITQQQYLRYGNQYRNRLVIIHKIMSEIKNKKAAILRPTQEIKNLRKEKEELLLLTKDLQRDYIVRRTVSREKFLALQEQYISRLVELEKEEGTLDEKLKMKNVSKRYRVLRWFYDFAGLIMYSAQRMILLKTGKKVVPKAKDIMRNNKNDNTQKITTQNNNKRSVMASENKSIENKTKAGSFLRNNALPRNKPAIFDNKQDNKQSDLKEEKENNAGNLASLFVQHSQQMDASGINMQKKSSSNNRKFTDSSKFSRSWVELVVPESLAWKVYCQRTTLWLPQKEKTKPNAQQPEGFKREIKNKIFSTSGISTEEIMPQRVRDEQMKRRYKEVS